MNVLRLVRALALAAGAIAGSYSAAPVLAQTGVDGVIGPEWSGPGVTIRTVTYDPGAPLGNFGTPGTTNHAVAYTTYFRGDGAYIYVAVQANPAGGGSAAGLQFANLYFSTTTPSNGSIAMEVTNNRFFRGGVNTGGPNNDGYYPATGYATWSSSVANGVIEVAIPYSFFETDPLGMGFAVATTQMRFNLSQSFGFSVAGGTDYNDPMGPDERLGLVQLTPQYAVTLQSPSNCTSGSTSVNLVLTSAPSPSLATGGQFFLSYDAGFFGTSITAGPGLQAVFTNINNTSHQATVAVGAILPGQVLHQGDVLATINFNDAGLYCTQSGLVSFRSNNPPTRLSDANGVSIDVTANALGALSLNDNVAPLINGGVPLANINHIADPGLCSWTGTVSPPSFSDNCSAVLSATIGGNSYDWTSPRTFDVGTTVITWTAVDPCGNTTSSNQNLVITDTQAPSITCPPDITVNADPGVCSATFTYVNTFDSPVPLSPTEAPGVWYVDRYAPAGFAQASFMGSNRLKESISSADSAANRPPAFSDIFYNTQGRKLDVDMPVGTTLSIDLWIPASWAANVRRADIWATTFDASNSVSGFPIIGFISNDPTDSINPTPAGPLVPRYRVWDDTNGVWIDLATPVVYNAFHTLSITLTASSFEYRIDGTLVQTLPDNGSIRIGNTIVQAYNFGQSYDVFWDNLLAGPQGPVVTDNCCVASVTAVRSDALTLFQPFPSGLTTVTWTATDCHGNPSSCVQNVTVNASNTVNLAVQEAGLSAPSTRCVTVDLWAGCSIAASVSTNVAFDATGNGTATFNVPCGPAYSAATVRDAKHSLRRTSDGPLSFSVFAGAYAVTFNTATGNALEQGNLNDDPYIDILDFGIFIGRFSLNLGPNSPCGYTNAFGNFHPDFDGDGIVGTGDFTFIQSGFLHFRDTDPCGGSILGPGPVTDISVDQLVARGMRDAAFGDFNLDGRLNAADIAYVAQHGLPRCTADFNDDQVTDISDIFSFLTAWFANHPKADINNNGSADVQDIFQFLNVWFQGC